jgi:uncharacterized membrane protein
MTTWQADRRHIVWSCLAIWIFAVSYAVVTPPFQVPDEVAHYWHSVSLAHGNVFQVTQNGRLGSYVPKSARDFVYLTWVETAGHPENKVGMARLRDAAQLPFQPEPVFRSYPALYTPIAYLPASLSGLVTNLLHVRPLIAFYAGRIVTATVAVLLIAAAMLECTALAAIIGAIASLPMALFLFGSYSSDALTISIALYVTALAWRVRSGNDVTRAHWARLCIATAALAMCKSVYAPIAFMALMPSRGTRATASMRIWRTILLLGSLAIGMALSAVMLARQYYPLRADTDPKAQLQMIEAHPLRFIGVVVQDYVAQCGDYRDQFVGRLGWVDIPLSGVLIAAVFFLLLATALTSDISITASTRIFALLLALLVCLSVSASQYIVWTPVGATHMEGIQGRYFLPVALILLLPFAAILRRRRLSLAVTVLYALAAVAINIDAFVLLVRRYY